MKFSPSTVLWKCSPPKIIPWQNPMVMSGKIGKFLSTGCIHDAIVESLFKSHRIHVWYIYLHLVDFYAIHVGKYTSPMDPLGISRSSWQLNHILTGWGRCSSPSIGHSLTTKNLDPKWAPTVALSPLSSRYHLTRCLEYGLKSPTKTGWFVVCKGSFLTFFLMPKWY